MIYVSDEKICRTHYKRHSAYFKCNHFVHKVNFSQELCKMYYLHSIYPVQLGLMFNKQLFNRFESFTTFTLWNNSNESDCDIVAAMAPELRLK